jgi:uncharacterized protein YndB with AHSA1/START domain
MGRTGRIDRAARTIPASPARVFAALTDADALVSWLPPAGMRARLDGFDARAGGGYRMVLTHQDPRVAGKTRANEDAVTVRFAAIEPDERIVQAVDFASDDPAFAGTMTMTWTVAPCAEGAVVEVRAEDVPPGISPADHATGMASSLENLAAYLAGRAADEAGR